MQFIMCLQKNGFLKFKLYINEKLIDKNNV